MRLIIILLIAVFLSSKSSAQFDSDKNATPFSAPITPSEPLVAPTNTFTFETTPLKSSLFPDLNAPKERKVDLIKKEEFVNPNEERARKLNAPEAELAIEIKGNRFLGEFRNNGKWVKIVCRDYGEVDGDRIRVYANDKVMVNEILLQGNYREIVIELVSGFNKIDFQALNQGDYGPNTAQFVMFDDQNKVISSNQWNLTTGTKASIIVVKE